MNVPIRGALQPIRPTTTTAYTLEELEGLPCGCVFAAYNAKPWDARIVSLEAKGQYCIFPEHHLGAILSFGNSRDFDDEEDSNV